MQVILGSAGLYGDHEAFVVGMGVFDGVHIGHQALLRKARELADQAGVPALAYTFHPHPATVLNPKLAPRLLEPLDARLEHIAELGLDAVLIESFSPEFAKIPALEFVQNVLVGKLRARHIVVGANFTFGHKAMGNVALLEQLGAQYGFGVHAVELMRVDGMEVSSTKAREFVSGGKMQGVRLLLGRPYSIAGTVFRGAGRGKTLGFPTANLRYDSELLPAIGVYAAYVHGPLEGLKSEPAVVNVGYAPTFGEASQLNIEAHLLDYRGPPLYGLPLTLELFERIREERRFDSADELKAQIQRDIDAARQAIEQVIEQQLA